MRGSDGLQYKHRTRCHITLATLVRGLQTFDYNALETLMLGTSLFILLAGMTFESGVTASGSSAHTALTVLVALVLVGCVTVFLGMLGREVWNSVRFARRHRRMSVVVRRQSAVAALAGSAPRSHLGPAQAGIVPASDVGPTKASSATTTIAAANTWTVNPLKGGAGVDPGPPLPGQASGYVQAGGRDKSSTATAASAPPWHPPPPPPSPHAPASSATLDGSGRLDSDSSFPAIAGAACPNKHRNNRVLRMARALGGAATSAASLSLTEASKSTGTAATDGTAALVGHDTP